jgi:hypothetical protein
MIGTYFYDFIESEKKEETEDEEKEKDKARYRNLLKHARVWLTQKFHIGNKNLQLKEVS